MPVAESVANGLFLACYLAFFLFSSKYVKIFKSKDAIIT